MRLQDKVAIIIGAESRVKGPLLQLGTVGRRRSCLPEKAPRC